MFGGPEGNTQDQDFCLLDISINGLTIDTLIRKGVECKFLTFSSLVFMKTSLCLMKTPQQVSVHHAFLVLLDKNEDQLGRILKLTKFIDGNIESAHVFYRDIDFIYPLMNLITCIGMCL